MTDRVNAGDGFSAISCPSTSLCVAASELGTITTSTDPADPASWTHEDIDGNTDIVAVSCPSTTLCVASDSAGNIFASTDPGDGADATWTMTANDVADGRDLPSLSCPSTSLCVAVDGYDDILVSTDPLGDASAWTASPIGSNPNNTFLEDLSCGSTSLCVATGAASGDLESELFTSTDPTGGTAAWSGGDFDSNDDLPGVSCTSDGMCLAVSGSGDFTRALLSPQSATTGSAGSVSDTTATLNGTVDPNGWDVSDCHFDYGTAADALDSSVPCTVSLPIPGTSSQVAVSAGVTGLTPGTPYYFQLVTTSADGTSSGAVQQFTSAQAPVTAPVLHHLGIAPRAFVAGPHHGTKISYHDTQASAAAFTVQREVSGVLKAGTCVAATRKPAPRANRCTIWRAVGGFSHQDASGDNTLQFTGRVQGRTLAPGLYQLRAVARFDGLTSNRVHASFRVKKR